MQVTDDKASKLRTEVVWMGKRATLESYLRTEIAEPGAQLKTEHDKRSQG